MKAFWQKFKIDIIVIASLLVTAITGTIVFFAIQKKNNLIANIYRENEIIETIDLSKEDESRTFTIDGYESLMTIEVKHNAIRVNHSSCPHQDCVNMGWVNKTKQPIVCTYNHVSIILTGKQSQNDVEVGK